MGNTKRTGGHTAAYIDDLHVCIVIAYIISNLLQAAQGGEIGNGICDCNISLHGNTAGYTGHMLFHNAAVIVPFGGFSGKTLDFAITNIRQNKMYSGIFFCNFGKHFIKDRSHYASTPSSR